MPLFLSYSPQLCVSKCPDTFATYIDMQYNYRRNKSYWDYYKQFCKPGFNNPDKVPCGDWRVSARTKHCLNSVITCTLKYENSWNRFPTAVNVSDFIFQAWKSHGNECNLKSHWNFFKWIVLFLNKSFF